MNDQAITSVWMLTREYGDIAGAGGVKDVAEQLSRALARWTKRKVTVVLPCYGFIGPDQVGFERLPDPDYPDRPLEFSVAMNYVGREREERVRVWFGERGRVRLFLLESERFAEKGGVYTYTREEYQRESWKVQGSGHFDYFAVNVLLQKAALDLIMILREHPQVIHCHDGHTAIVPALMRECAGYRHYFRSTAAVVTIHNAGTGYHQEVSDLPFVQAVTGLPWTVVQNSCLDQSFDPFIAAGHYAGISTVSENYARELQETDSDYLTGWLGHRLRDLGVTIAGITNGIDPDRFNPMNPEQGGIPAAFDVAGEASGLPGKMVCKRDLLDELAIASPEDVSRTGYLGGDEKVPLYTFIGRLSEQKGVDILIQAVRLFLARETAAQFIFLGDGSELAEDALIRLSQEDGCVGRVCFLRGFNAALANRVYAAGDFFVIPSRYEPCGLTDYIAQLFGNLPIVHHVGGLVKVVDGQTGFAYHDNSVENCAEALRRAFTAYGNPEVIRNMQRLAVEKIFRQHTWIRVSKDYVDLYKAIRAELAG